MRNKRKSNTKQELMAFLPHLLWVCIYTHQSRFVQEEEVENTCCKLQLQTKKMCAFNTKYSENVIREIFPELCHLCCYTTQLKFESIKMYSVRQNKPKDKGQGCGSTVKKLAVCNIQGTVVLTCRNDLKFGAGRKTTLSQQWFST